MSSWYLSQPGQAIPGDAALVILPGSKATLADLAALRARGLGHRHPRASPPRRARAGDLRRLPDARPHDRRSRRARGRAGAGRDSACSMSRRCSAATSDWVGDAASRSPAAAGARLRNASRRDDRRRPARPMLDSAAGATAPSAPMAKSPAATCTAFSPATNSAARFSPGSAPHRVLAYEASIDAMLDGSPTISKRPRPRRRPRRLAAARLHRAA